MVLKYLLDAIWVADHVHRQFCHREVRDIAIIAGKRQKKTRRIGLNAADLRQQLARSRAGR